MKFKKFLCGTALVICSSLAAFAMIGTADGSSLSLPAGASGNLFTSVSSSGASFNQNVQVSGKAGDQCTITVTTVSTSTGSDGQPTTTYTDHTIQIAAPNTLQVEGQNVTNVSATNNSTNPVTVTATPVNSPTPSGGSTAPRTATPATPATPRQGAQSNS